MSTISRLFLAIAAFASLAEPASAHHLMGGRMPATFGEGILSGLGHPVIGLDHFAAVVAVGCLAAAHRQGAALALAFVIAMMCGVAVHLQAVMVPADEIPVAASVITTRRDIASPPRFAVNGSAGVVRGRLINPWLRAR